MELETRRCKHGLPAGYCAECKRRPKRAGKPVSDHVHVSAQEADEFFTAVVFALKTQSYDDLARVMLIGRSHPGVAISFDAEWEPFLGHTLGYNNYGKPPRLPIHQPSQVLYVAKVWLMRLGRAIRGGRVFINANGVLCDGASIGQWDWRGEDPVSKVASIYLCPS